MAEDRVIFGADASEYFDVIARMQTQIDQLAKAHGRFNAGVGDQSGTNAFLRGEFRVETQARLLTQNLLAARNASEALQAGLQGIVLSSRIPLLGAIAAIGVVEGFKLILEQAEKTKKAYLELEVELAKPLGIQTQQSADAIGSDLEKLTEKVKALRKELNSNTTAVKNFLANNFFTAIPGVPSVAPGGRPEERAVVAGQTRLKELAEAQADAELRIVDIKRQGIEVSNEGAAIEKAQLDFENARAKILESAFKPGADQETIFKRIAALQQERDLTIKTARDKRSAENDSLAHARELADIERRGLGKQDDTIAKLTSELAYRLQILKAAQKLGEIKGIAGANVGVAQAQAGVENEQRTFLGDVGSNRAFDKFKQEQHAKFEIELGKETIDQLREDRKKGIPLDEFLNKILDEANALDKSKKQASDVLSGQEPDKSKNGLNALSNQDFSGLAALGNLPFSGLQSLNGLTITIQ